MTSGAFSGPRFYHSAADMSDVTRSVSRKQTVDIQIRRYPGVAECDVVVAARGREIIITCPDYDRALRWAQMECKSYKVTPQFADAPVGFYAA